MSICRKSSWKEISGDFVITPFGTLLRAFSFKYIVGVGEPDVSDLGEMERSLAVNINEESSCVDSPSTIVGSSGPVKLTGGSNGMLAPPTLTGVDCLGEFSVGSEMFGSNCLAGN